MNVTQRVAGGSRNVEATRAFLSERVVSTTPGEISPFPSSSYAWKRAYLSQIWKADFPLGIMARAILTVLLEHSDSDGRTWLGLQKLAAEAGISNLRTVRNALTNLVQAGWLRYAAQTWSSLTAEQAAAGRPVPRRNNAGQAPNLYVLLDGRGQPMTRPGLVRTSTVEAQASSNQHPDETPGQNCPTGLEQNCPGEGRAKLPYDPDPVRSLSKNQSVEGEAPGTSTHNFLKGQGDKGDWGWLESWQLVVEAHASKTKGAYGLAPMEPDVKRLDRKAMAECLDGASAEVAAKLRARGAERELGDVRRELATRSVALYFRNDTAHLRKTKHALRDLPREFHARITEAMQLILRESHDVKVPRRTGELELEQIVTTAKPVEVVKPVDRSTQSATAREARRLIEVLKGSPLGTEPSRPSTAEPTPPSQPTRLAEPERFIAEQEKPNQSAKGAPEMPEALQRVIGRPGAPRWGALGPSPAKVRRVSRPEPEGPGEGGEPPSTE